MIELFEQDKKDASRKSSKGNQLKWEHDGRWYKADYTGYEGGAEYIISHLLQKSSLQEDEYVLYDQEQIKYKHSMYNGAVSSDFLNDGYEVITLERLFKNIYAEGLNSIIYNISDHTKRLETTVNMVERTTGLRNFGVYMQKMLAIDALFLNEDRHTHNMAVLINMNNKYPLCPFFDHGAGLLSDTTMDYPLDTDVYTLIPEVKSKTFLPSFDEQLEIAEKLYGNNISFFFTKKDVEKLLDSLAYYDAKVADRIRDVVFFQMRKYSYLFK